MQFSIMSDDLFKALTLTSFCTSDEGIGIRGVLFETTEDNILYVVGCDKHRMSVFNVQLHDNLTNEKVVVDAKNIKLLSESIKPRKHRKPFECMFKMSEDGKNVYVVSDDDTYMLRIINEEYPQWREVQPKGETSQVNFKEGINLKYIGELAKALGKIDKDTDAIFRGVFKADKRGYPVVVETVLINFTHIIMPVTVK